MEKMNLLYKPSNFDVKFHEFEFRPNSEDEIEKAADEVLYFIDKDILKLIKRIK